MQLIAAFYLAKRPKKFGIGKTVDYGTSKI